MAEVPLPEVVRRFGGGKGGTTSQSPVKFGGGGHFNGETKSTGTELDLVPEIQLASFVPEIQPVNFVPEMQPVNFVPEIQSVNLRIARLSRRCSGAFEAGIGVPSTGLLLS